MLDTKLRPYFSSPHYTRLYEVCFIPILLEVIVQTNLCSTKKVLKFVTAYLHDRKSNLGSQSILAVMFSLIVFKIEVMLVRSTLKRAVWVRTLVGYISLSSRQDTLLSQCLSPPRSINWYQRT